MSLQSRRVAVLAEQSYQELELWYPVMRFREEGAEVVVAAPSPDQAYESRLGYPLLATCAISGLDPQALDAVIIPGGEAGQRLQHAASAVDLVRLMHGKGAVTAAIGTGRNVLTAAGAAGHGEPAQGATADGPVVTAASPDDLPEFFRLVHRALLAKEGE